MANELVPNNQMEEVQPGLLVDRRNLVKYVDAMGRVMQKYVYWMVKTKDKTYKLGNPADYQRLVKSVASPTVRFVQIGNDLINVLSIESIQKKTGSVLVEDK